MDDSHLSYPDLARVLGTALMSTGAGLLVFVVLTVVWGDPFTRLQEREQQRSLAQNLETDDSALTQDVGLDPRLTRVAARRHKRTLAAGAAAGRLVIPRIKVNKVIVKNAAIPDLKKGPGIYGETGFPGSGGPVAIAGHRTTYGAPFLNIDRLKPGHKIRIDMPYGRFEYTVAGTRIIGPRDWSIIQVGAAEKPGMRRRMQQGICPAGTCEHLVLTACHPKYSAAQRIAVFARLTSVSLRKGAGA